MTWPVSKLNAVCEISMGQAPDGSTYNDRAVGLPLVAGAGDFGDFFPSPKKYTSAPGKRSAVGDIILCIRATIGDTNWSDKEYCLGRGVAGLRARDGLLDSGFLWHFIGARRSELESRGTGSTFKQVSRADIAEWLIPTPPMAEQQRIAAILDKADSLRRKRLEAIRLADEFLRAAYLDLAQRHPARAPVETLLAEIPNSARTGPFGSQLLVSEFTESGIPVLGIDNVVSNAFTWGAPRFISAEKYAVLERYTVRPGDVMVSIMGTTGRVAIAPDDLPICISTKHLCTLTLDHKKMLPTYLWACLRWDPDVRAQTLREAKGAIMEGWNMGIVKGLLVNSPPMNVQIKFEESANRIKRVRSAQALAANGTDELMASLSAKHF
jgi:type I restriction enzyme S subunit